MRDRHLILGEQGATTLSGGSAGANSDTGDACRIDWLNAEQGRIGMRCSCPAFIADGPCEHLWALLLLADEQTVGAAIAGVGRLVGYDLTDLVIDDETAGSVLANGFRVDSASTSTDTHTEAHTRSAAGAAPALAQASEAVHVLHGEAPPASVPREWSLWYVLNLQLCERQDAFVIEFFRAASDDGKPLAKGPLRPARLTEASLDELHGDERTLVALMLRRQIADGSTMAHQPRRAQEQHSYAVVTGDLCERIIPRLLRSGRLLARANARALPAPGRPLRADDAPPLRLHLLMMERRSSWLLTASLVQEHANTKSIGERSWP